MNRYEPHRHHRRSIRLKGYDYTQGGAYFVTVVAQNRSCLFGNVVEGVMCPNDAGRLAGNWWVELNRKFPNVDVDKHVVMPNHFHGIIRIVGANLCVRPSTGQDIVPNIDPCVCPEAKGAHTGAPLPTVVQWFKTMTTNEYIRGVKQRGWPKFRGRLWQRSYFEHIIRDDASLNRIRRYILENPARWDKDPENPTRQATRPQTYDR